MRVGVPKEIKADENRVALTPSGVAALGAHGHEVTVERGAGRGSSIDDAAYVAAGARLGDVDAAWAADLVLKVKEPVVDEYRHLRPELILFTYLHLAANEGL